MNANGSALARVPGVGPKLAATLRRRFGSDESALHVLKSGDIAALRGVDGLSERRALDLARAAASGSDVSDAFLATDAARRIRDGIIDAIQAFAATSHGRDRIALRSPYATPAEAQASMRDVLAAKAEIAALDRAALAQALRRLRKPTEPTPVRQLDAMVICESEEIRAELQKAGVEAWVELGGPEALAQAHEAGLVVAVYEEGRPMPELDALVELPASSPAYEVAPAMALAWFRANRGVIQACAHVAQLRGKPTKANEAITAVDAAEPPKVEPARLPHVVEQVRVLADARLRTAAAGLSLRGDEVLQALGAKWPAALKAVVDEAVAYGHAELKQRTGLDLDVFEATFPLEVDEEEVERAVRQASGHGRVVRFEAERRAARHLAPLRKALEAEIQAHLAFDERFALGCFALHHDLQLPVLGDALHVEGGLNLHLSGRPGVQPITYALGDRHPVAILTGANSGGKSTLLEHLAQLVIMARLGLPVIGSATVPWIEELHVVAGRRALDAGALETFLKGFLPLAEAKPGRGRRMILADEVEAMTELEAAGRILAFFVERVAASGSLCLLVSHMAQAILDRVATDTVRVDGIEAEGLDASFRLVVNRAPRMGHHARSTPELIVQRLAHTATGAQRELFGQLAAALAGGAQPGQTGQRAPSSRTALSAHAGGSATHSQGGPSSSSTTASVERQEGSLGKPRPRRSRERANASR